MNALRDGLAKSTRLYVTKQGAYIELVLLLGLNGTVLWKGLYDLDSFLEFLFGHGGSEAIVRCLMPIINRWLSEAGRNAGGSA